MCFLCVFPGSVLPDESTAAPPPIKAARMVPALSRGKCGSCVGICPRISEVLQKVLSLVSFLCVEVSKDVTEQVEAKRADSEGGPTQKKGNNGHSWPHPQNLHVTHKEMEKGFFFSL